MKAMRIDKGLLAEIRRRGASARPEIG